VVVVSVISTIPPLYFMSNAHVLVVGQWPHEVTYPLQQSWTISLTWMESPCRLDVDSLGLFDVIVIHNVPAAFLTADFQLKLVEEIVQGKGLVVFGGPFAFGCGEYQSSYFSQVLPVACESRTFATQTAELQTVAQHEIVEGINVSRIRPTGYNELTVKPINASSLVVDRVRDYPMVVVGEYGEGRVVTFAFGDATVDGSTLDTLLFRVVNWLSPRAYSRSVCTSYVVLFILLVVGVLIPFYALKVRRYHIR
jgi:hypothetical protein